MIKYKTEDETLMKHGILSPAIFVKIALYHEIQFIYIGESTLIYTHFVSPNVSPFNTFRFCRPPNVSPSISPSVSPTPKKRYFRPFKPAGNPLSQRKSFEYDLNTNKTTTYRFLLGATG